MNIRQAILKAADSIEQNPDMYDFHSITAPDCGTPGCAIGWIVAHSQLDLPYEDGLEGRARYWGRHEGYSKLLGVDDAGFYNLMDSCGDTNWHTTPQKCAQSLRLYADKYHPATDHIPASIRQIFETQQVAA